jgi:hypothetical protein
MMVNAGMVNARRTRPERAHFREILPVFRPSKPRLNITGCLKLTICAPLAAPAFRKIIDVHQLHKPMLIALQRILKAFLLYSIK